MNQALIQLAIEEAPAMLSLLKTSFHRAHPNAPEPTSEQIVSAYKQALQASLDTDKAWLAEHPPTA